MQGTIIRAKGMPSEKTEQFVLSVIVPVLNEVESLPALLGRVIKPGIEVIVVDGGSTDGSGALAQSLGAKVLYTGIPCRPIQLNTGASAATAPLYWFVHADTLPPQDAISKILNATDLNKNFGCFRFKFQSTSRQLSLNSYCTRMPFMICRGGDQSLFITKSLFEKLGGYSEKHVVMEDYDIIRRGRKYETFHILPFDVEVSARKYNSNSYVRVNLANFLVFTLYYMGVSPRRLKSIYSKLIRHPKFGMPDK